MSEVDVNIGALESLRRAVEAFADNQRRAIEGIDHETQRTLGILEGIRGDWEREKRRRQVALRECEIAALAAAAVGDYWDCSGPAGAVEEAQRELQRVVDWTAQVEAAASTWRASAGHYQAYLDSVVPSVSAGLDARVTSLEAYQAWHVGQAGSLGGLGASDLGALEARVAGLRREKATAERGQVDRLAQAAEDQVSPHYPPGAGYDVERREGNVGGPERRG